MTPLAPPSASAKHTVAAGPRPWQQRLGRFFARPSVELAIGFLVLISVGLTLLEFALGAYDERSENLDLMQRLVLDNDAILVAVEASDGQIRINPSEHRFLEGDRLVVIANGKPDLSE